MVSDMVRWALIYAKQGMSVFPLAPESKEPLRGSNGLLDATTDPDRIKAWWTEHPNANIGLNCEQSGLFVLDVDTKPGKVGAQSLLTLIGEDFSLLLTRQSKTWSGGAHYFYTGEGKSTVSVLGKDLDTRGRGGYVVLPPSRVTEHGKSGVYSWVKNDDENPGKTLPCLPLPDLFRPREGAVAAASSSRVRDIVRIEEGGRNAELTRIAGLYRRIGMAPSAIGAALGVDNATRCVPPLPEREVDAIAKSVGKYEPHTPLEEPRSGGSFRFHRTSDVAERANEHVEWIVEGLIRSSGVCLISARPGAGKSTLMRTLAACITSGHAWLSRRCKQGPVAWIGMEESDQDYVGALEDMGLLENDDIWYAGQNDIPPENRLVWLEGFVTEMKPAVVIIDTLAAFLAIKDINHYTEVGKALDPVLALRGRHGTAFVLIHHNNNLDLPLGSTKILALVDTAITMAVSPEGQRTIKTLKQRSGVPLEETILKYDEDTRWLTADEPKWIADQRHCENNILAYLTLDRWATRQELAHHAGRKGAIARNAVDSLLAKGLLRSEGTGKKGEPKRYASTVFRQGSFLGNSQDSSDSSEAAANTQRSRVGEESEESELVRGSPRQSEASPKQVRGIPKNPVDPQQSEESEESVGLLVYADRVLGHLQEAFDERPREHELPLG